LGAGVSSGVGLPSWRSLIEGLRNEVGLSNDKLDSSADALQRAADEVRRKCGDDERAFAELVKRCLYCGVKLDERLLQNPLLIALGALMMGSRRGSVKRVVSFNFDSVLEWYISLYGFVPHVVLQPPAKEGAEDVRIYHPHGFLPHPALDADSSEFVVLGLKSINLRLGKPHDEWLALLRHVLLSGIGLFVGLSEHSFRDRALAPLLTEVATQLKGRRPTGFWVLKHDGDDKEKDALNQEFLECNIVPLQQMSFEDVPKLLLDVCQQAAKTVTVSK
jgi:hypothetical protein